MHADSNPRVERPPTAPMAVPTLVGFAAVTGQIVLMREVIALFNGNELSLGIVLGAWLGWTAAGTSLISWLMRRRLDIRIAVAMVECVSGFSLLVTIPMLRGARTYLQTVPGELLGPIPIALIVLGSLSVFCSLSGCLFALAARMYHQSRDLPEHLGTSYAYLLETAGSALGGVLTSILLLRFFGSFQIAMIVALTNITMAAYLILGRRSVRAAVAATAAAFSIPLLIYVAPRMEEASQQRMWKGFQLVDTRESIYGKITVLQAGGLRSIYDNGTILANVPDIAAAEETVHYALLAHPNPRRVLLIGGGLNGSVAEAIKHPMLRRLDYVELDPALIGMFQRLFPAESARAFSDSRVRVHYVDGRSYLSSTDVLFDEIILGVPDPDNVLLNRFYTTEFFRSARNHLAPGGILALQLRASAEAIGPELRDFLRCIHLTMQGIFPYVAVIPGGTIHMFGAAQPGVLTEDPRVFIARLRERRVDTLYVREYFIPFRMMPDRMEQIHRMLRPLPETTTNSDFHPVAYYFGAVLWSAQFKSSYACLLKRAAGISFPALLAGLAGISLLLVLAWMAVPKKRVRVAAAWSVIATGYTLMALQILLLLTFQSVYGYVYRELSMLIGMFMAGIAAGSWLGIARVRSGDLKWLLRIAAFNQLLIACSAPLLLALVKLLSRSPGMGGDLMVSRIAFPALALLCGIPGGYQFPLASGFYQQGMLTKMNLGALYALDLAGGCVGALLLAGFLIPLLGFWDTAWLTALMSAAPAIVLSFAVRGPLANSN